MLRSLKVFNVPDHLFCHKYLTKSQCITDYRINLTLLRSIHLQVIRLCFIGVEIIYYTQMNAGGNIIPKRTIFRKLKYSFLQNLDKYLCFLQSLEVIIIDLTILFFPLIYIQLAISRNKNRRMKGMAVLPMMKSH